MLQQRLLQDPRSLPVRDRLNVLCLDVFYVVQEALVVLRVQVQVLRHAETLLKTGLVLEVEQQRQLADLLFLSAREHSDLELVGKAVEAQHLHVLPQVTVVAVDRRLRLRRRNVLALLEQLLIRGLLLLN